MENEVDFSNLARRAMDDTSRYVWQIALGRAIVFALLSIAQQINWLGRK